MRQLALSLLLMFPGLPTLAQGHLAFHAPSGNIHCRIGSEHGGLAQCDIIEFTPNFDLPEEYCRGYEGFSFFIDSDNEAWGTCAENRVADPASFVLEYDHQITFAGITCTSRRTGMTCENEAGHGFHVSRARQELF